MTCFKGGKVIMKQEGLNGAGNGRANKVKEDNEHPRPLKKEIWKPNTVEVS